MDNRKSLKKPGGGLGLKILLTPEVGILFPIVILCVVTTMIKPNFMTWKYMSSILKASIFIGAAALGQTFVQLCGEVDLSVGMNGCLAGIMMGVACDWWGLPLVPCILVALFFGGLVGAVNGLCVCKLGLSSWITTLATQFICQGLAVTVSQGEPISVKALGTSGFTRAKPLGLSWMFFIFVFLIIALDIVIRKTKFGYKLRAVGGNKEAALMAGVGVKKVQLAAFIIAGVLAAAGGVFDVLSNAAASSSYGAGREFRTLICCAIGGVSGGSGSVFGVALGILLFHVLWYALSILGIDKNLQLVLIGFILVLAVLMNIQRKRYEARQVTL